MKTIPVLAIVVCAALAGCGQIGRIEAQWMGYSRSCVDGVSYLQFASGVTVEYTREGKVKPCQ